MRNLGILSKHMNLLSSSTKLPDSKDVSANSVLHMKHPEITEIGIVKICGQTGKISQSFSCSVSAARIVCRSKTWRKTTKDKMRLPKETLLFKRLRFKGDTEDK